MGRIRCLFDVFSLFDVYTVVGGDGVVAVVCDNG